MLKNMLKKKSRSIITTEYVPIIFDDACVVELVKTAKLPPSVDLAALARGIREAARIFARDARIPTGNELHDEIGELHKLADRQQCDEVAGLLDKLSPRARDILQERGARPSIRLELPSPDALRDPARREEACQTIARLCQFGGQYVEGRRRPSGKRSGPFWRPQLYAPNPRRNFPRREAERDFAMWLSIAWLEATGAAPSRTARAPDESRDVGPFARFVRECLDLVGAGDADVVELLNELQRRRREMERRTSAGPLK